MKLIPNNADDDYHAALAIITKAFKKADTEDVRTEQECRELALSLLQDLATHDPALLLCSFDDDSPLKQLGF